MASAPNQNEARILSHLPQVRALAVRLAARTGGNLEADDLASAGTVGLLDAAARFEEKRGISFGAFVLARVHGAMLDVMRGADHLCKSAPATVKATPQNKESAPLRGLRPRARS
jgi:RNA polymerase sigma factor FliA